jgi:Zn finger protein HypA/HybF involved in hydrogenase expression
VSISKVPAAQTVRAATQQPCCFEGFHTSAELLDRVTVRRQMICECGGSQGILEARQGWDTFPYADPLSYTCLSCEAERTFFDSHRDGYDNVMGNGATSTQGEKITTVGCPTCKGFQFAVTSELLYNIEASEIDEELGESSKFGPSDCFDAINVYASCPSCKERFYVGGWELA